MKQYPTADTFGPLVDNISRSLAQTVQALTQLETLVALSKDLEPDQPGEQAAPSLFDAESEDAQTSIKAFEAYLESRARILDNDVHTLIGVIVEGLMSDEDKQRLEEERAAAEKVIAELFSGFEDEEAASDEEAVTIPIGREGQA